MHTMWKGAISFGLVNIPIKMHAATEDRSIKFKYLHKECKTPVQYVRRCPTCNIDLEWKDIVKGYEYESGRYIIVDDEELAELRENTSRAIEILDFISLEEIDPIYFDKSYYLSPQDKGSKAYSLLQKVMSETRKVAVARVTMRSKQYLAALRCYSNCLVMETLFYPDEIRDTSLIEEINDSEGISTKELDMARQIIQNLTAPFDPEKYTDQYRAALQEFIKKKIEGKEYFTVPEKEVGGNIIDLMEALKASIEATKNEDTANKKEKRKKKKATAS